METGLALATRDQVNEIANVDPATAWLYQGGGKRLAINNETRNGFDVKSGGDVSETLPELHAQLLSVASLHSHRQPDDKQRAKGAQPHADSVEWCESHDNKQTSTNGYQCADCAAKDDCKWKIELTMMLADREEEYRLTIPTASAMRFKQAAQKLAQYHKRHFTQAVWRMWVTVEKSNGNVYPVVNYQVFDENGNELSLTGKPNGNGATPTPQPQPQSAAPKLQAPTIQRPPAKTLSTQNFPTWRAWCDQLVAEEPYYNDPHAPSGKVVPAHMHIRATAAKIGFSEINDQNADEIKFMLLEYARNAREEQTAKQVA